MVNHHLEALLKQDKDQVQGTKKSKIEKAKYEFWNSLKPTASPETIKDADGLQATNNTEILNVLTFIQQAMDTH